MHRVYTVAPILRSNAGKIWMNSSSFKSNGQQLQWTEKWVSAFICIVLFIQAGNADRRYCNAFQLYQYSGTIFRTTISFDANLEQGDAKKNAKCVGNKQLGQGNKWRCRSAAHVLPIGCVYFQRVPHDAVHTAYAICQTILFRPSISTVTNSNALEILSTKQIALTLCFEQAWNESERVLPLFPHRSSRSQCTRYDRCWVCRCTQHELGHFIDDALGRPSRWGDRFLSGLAAAAQDITRYILWANDAEWYAYDAFSTGAAFDRNITDIISFRLSQPIP